MLQTIEPIVIESAILTKAIIALFPASMLFLWCGSSVFSRKVQDIIASIPSRRNWAKKWITKFEGKITSAKWKKSMKGLYVRPVRNVLSG